ncbi:MAG TPA: prepilin-type N-terminal cleavage/methylation domain-containing protein [Phycisphaerales bacterium]|nr:prepilin-type N-terminal cleavage/methylation domain-containing protein [Phycisphaerales bacterium]
MIKRTRTGFSLVELLVVIAIIALLIGILVPTLSKAKEASKKAKDAAQIRSTLQAMNVWAGANDGYFPLPSLLDSSDSTVKATNAREKDNTGNILSILIWNDHLQPEDLVSPLETNVEVEVDTRYEKERPQQAEKPEFAQWDPGFAGVTDEDGMGATGTGRGRRSEKGNNSYAYLPPFGARREMWSSNATSDVALMSNRGTIYTLGSDNEWVIKTVGLANGNDSNTLEFTDPRTSWSGNIGFGDLSVAFSNRPDPSRLGLVETTTGSNVTDNIFVNEGDNGRPANRTKVDRGVNSYLRPWYNVVVQNNEISAIPWDLEDRASGRGGGD